MAGYPDTSAPAGTSFVTAPRAATVASSPISTCPVAPDCPPMRTFAPTAVLPAMPTCAAIAAFSPTRTLCATCTRLSSFAPAAMTVLPKRARSMVAFAPISTSSPISTVPTWGIFFQPFASRTYPNPSLPMTAPLWTITRHPIRHRSRTLTSGYRRQSSPIPASLPTKHWAQRTLRSPIVTPSSTTQCGPITTSRPIATFSPTTAVA